MSLCVGYNSSYMSSSVVDTDENSLGRIKRRYDECCTRPFKTTIWRYSLSEIDNRLLPQCRYFERLLTAAFGVKDCVAKMLFIDFIISSRLSSLARVIEQRDPGLFVESFMHSSPGTHRFVARHEC